MTDNEKWWKFEAKIIELWEAKIIICYTCSSRRRSWYEVSICKCRPLVWEINDGSLNKKVMEDDKKN